MKSLWNSAVRNTANWKRERNLNISAKIYETNTNVQWFDFFFFLNAVTSVYIVLD